MIFIVGTYTFSVLVDESISRCQNMQISVHIDGYGWMGRSLKFWINVVRDDLLELEIIDGY